MENILAAGFFGLLMVLVIFLVCRAIVLWYWKIDKVVTLLESINAKLGPEPGKGALEKGMAARTDYQPPVSPY